MYSLIVAGDDREGVEQEEDPDREGVEEEEDPDKTLSYESMYSLFKCMCLEHTVFNANSIA